MKHANNLNQVFKIWQNAKICDLEKIADKTPHINQHLTKNTLISLAVAGGLAEASPETLEHLDYCPQCLSEWAAWRRAFSVSEKASENELEKKIEGTDVFAENRRSEEIDKLDDNFLLGQAFGYLEAAASTNHTNQALVLESECGTYRLEILPDRQNNNQGMVIITKLIKNQLQAVSVRDRRGQIILSGPLTNDRLARIHKNLDKLDLSIWTVS